MKSDGRSLDRPYESPLLPSHILFTLSGHASSVSAPDWVHIGRGSEPSDVIFLCALPRSWPRVPRIRH